MHAVICPPRYGDTVKATVLDGESLPWLPLTPHSPAVRIKHFRLDPIRGEMISLIRAPARAQMPSLLHSNSAVVYTLEGHWKFAGHDWIAGPGSVALIPAQTTHQTQVMDGCDGALTFHITTGDVTLLDTDMQPLAVLNWKTALDRYLAYCHQHCIEPKDLTAH